MSVKERKSVNLPVAMVHVEVYVPLWVIFSLQFSFQLAFYDLPERVRSHNKNSSDDRHSASTKQR
jgi:hypothetical protein